MDEETVASQAEGICPGSPSWTVAGSELGALSAVCPEGPAQHPPLLWDNEKHAGFGARPGFCPGLSCDLQQSASLF